MEKSVHGKSDFKNKWKMAVIRHIFSLARQF